MMADEPVIPEGPIELEAAPAEFKPVHDLRPHMEEPLPVNLVAVADVRLLAPGGLDLNALENFYVGLWGFQRDASVEGVAFRAENFRILFDWKTPIVERDAVRPLGVEIPSLTGAIEKLNAAELPYERQKGIDAGTESIFVQDPAGNWLELVERRIV